MANITFVDAAGESRTVSIAEETTLMEGAVLAGINGIDADCGGAGICATCQVVVDNRCASLLPPPTAAEVDLLDMAKDPQVNSRLACFIKVAPSYDGLVVHIPSSQR
ncbi:2Fe-2S iron-sulfur cluster-binding protein [Sphingobium sp. V4]|uniref:2Fe-2S iron-sulfur cluster-binding protein n=1 Tax=Sphingobium sp. V4 TaxID=3038927 RepID=UPI00255832D1|nr:2Fe-2S iron-sulfur cluster-binding protein [Sphingobium sp. V4]WIW89516.1 2Fe-2S iron-sulfur cluster-binding protein [Sphingobium sp. V4]